MTYILGYIEEDWIQVKKFKRRLKEYWFDVISYDFNKGMTIDSLMKQVYDSDIDLLMIDYRLNETNIVSFNWDEVERRIYKDKPLFPHIIFTNLVSEAEPAVDDMKIILDKADVINADDPENIPRFVNMLKKSIDQYKALISEKKGIIHSLVQKAESEKLTSKEKDTLWSAERDLRSFDKSLPNEIPEHLVKQERLESMEAARKDIEAFLKSL